MTTLIAVDCSASMSMVPEQQIRESIEKYQRVYEDARVVAVGTWVSAYNPKDKILHQRSAGGGFSEEALKNFAEAIHADRVILITDGDIDLKNMDVFPVLVGQGEPEPPLTLALQLNAEQRNQGRIAQVQDCVKSAEDCEEQGLFAEASAYATMAIMYLNLADRGL